jgi:hypothetical protein
MIQLKVQQSSSIDYNLECYFNGYGSIEGWIRKVKLLPCVKDAKWVNGGEMASSYTLITFESEAHKTWFVLRWS